VSKKGEGVQHAIENARWLVPKMVKNGFNSAFRLQKGWFLQRKYELRPSSKLNLNPKRRIKTILHQFRNTHARYKKYGFKNCLNGLMMRCGWDGFCVCRRSTRFLFSVLLLQNLEWNNSTGKTYQLKS